MGLPHDNCILVDTKGVIYQGRTEGMNQWKSAHAARTDARSLAEASAEDWGAYRIVSASTPEFVLETVGDVKEGAVVSIQKPGSAANQKWIVVPGEGSVRVSPAQDPSLVLSVEKGGNKNGTPVVLEKDRGEAWQRWSIAKHENGSYSLLAKHAPEYGLDHNAGKRKVGADKTEAAPADK